MYKILRKIFVKMLVISKWVCYTNGTVKQRNATYRVACCHCIRHPSWVEYLENQTLAQLKPLSVFTHIGSSKPALQFTVCASQNLRWRTRAS